MTPETTRPAIAFERVVAFHSLARDLRQLQVLYRKTLDPMMRRKVEALEQQFDTQVGWLAADIAAVQAVNDALAIAEGGAM